MAPPGFEQAASEDTGEAIMTSLIKETHFLKTRDHHQPPLQDSDTPKRCQQRATLAKVQLLLTTLYPNNITVFIQ